MAFLSSRPAGQWKYEVRPFGAQLCASFLYICAVGIAAGAGEQAFRTGGDSPSLGLPALVLIAAILIRARRIGVWADADRVVVQNFWRTHDLRWDDVAKIEAFGWDRYSAPKLLFRMRNGTSAFAQGVPATFDGASDAVYDIAHVSRTPVEVVEH